MIFTHRINPSRPPEKPVVHLEPHSDAVQIGFGGKLLELINAPAIIRLPKFQIPKFSFYLVGFPAIAFPHAIALVKGMLFKADPKLLSEKDEQLALND